MLIKLSLFFILVGAPFIHGNDLFEDLNQGVILETKQLQFESFPGAFNPSLIRWKGQFLLSFRYCPDWKNQPWHSEIGIVALDEACNPLHEPELLPTRTPRSKTPPQAEDARFFVFRERLFIIYNDNVDEIFFDRGKRRDLFIAELLYEQGRYRLAPPLKLKCPEKYSSHWVQKNWVPFEWENELYFSYSINPHEVIKCNLKNGACFSLYWSGAEIDWPYGPLRGSSDAQHIDGEYLAFFHSSLVGKSSVSKGWKSWHYFMGAYTFSPEPPFKITRVSSKPLLFDNFYSPRAEQKKVIFPGGFVVDGPLIYLAYGKDDAEIWIATLSKQKLMESLR